MTYACKIRNFWLLISAIARFWIGGEGMCERERRAWAWDMQCRAKREAERRRSWRKQHKTNASDALSAWEAEGEPSYMYRRRSGTRKERRNARENNYNTYNNLHPPMMQLESVIKLMHQPSQSIFGVLLTSTWIFDRVGALGLMAERISDNCSLM